MGVKGLWRLLESTGQPVTLESLEGKILAVDISLWLNQAVKGMRGRDGNPIANAHLVVLFNRICKLLFYRIKPVFVFDGGVPLLKKQTLALRSQRQDKAVKESNKARQKLLQNFLKKTAITTVLGTNVVASTSHVIISSPSKQTDMYELPAMKPSQDNLESDSSQDSWSQDIQQELIQEQFQDINDIDIHSESFRALPLEIQHELLVEMKDHRKMRSVTLVNELPKKANDFSSFQLAGLLKKSNLSQRLNSIRKEMNSKESGETVSMLKHDVPNETRVESRRVVSANDQHYILIKGLSNKKDVEDSNVDQDTNGKPVIAEMPIQKESQDELVVIDCELAQVKSVQVIKEIDPKHVYDKDVIFDGNRKSPDSDKVELTDKNEKTTTGNQLNLNTDHECEVVDLTKAATYDTHKNIYNKNLRDIDKTNQSADTAVHPVKIQEEVHAKRDSSAMFKNIAQVSEKVDVENINGKLIAQPNSEELTLTSKLEDQMYEVVNMKPEVEVVSMKPEVEVVSMKPEVEVAIINPYNESSSEDDLIEVVVNPSEVSCHDDLFPAEIFVKEIKVCASPQREVAEVDISQQFGRIHEVDVARKEDQKEDEKEILVTISEESDASAPSPVDKWAGKTLEEVEAMEVELDNEGVALMAEKNKQERFGASITDQMYVEAKELLTLFGLPYITSVQEAEAQCAYLNLTDQTYGTITDDSDIWLFGGKRVYKNMFNQKKFVECYIAENIERQLLLNRDKMIQIAYLVGSDYTTGITGIGGVTAMELLHEFEGGDKLEPLNKFREWWEEAQKQVKLPSSETKVKSKLRTVQVHSGFPNINVREAYMNPAIDESTEAFTWGLPDLTSLREFANEKLGWTKLKTDEVLLPVMKKLHEKTTQTKMNHYFPVELNEPRKVKSKRINQVLNRHLRGNTNVLKRALPKTSVDRMDKVKCKKAKKKTDMNSESNSSEYESDTSTKASQRTPSTRVAAKTRTKNKGKAVARRTSRKTRQATSKARQQVTLEVNLSESSSD
ncbi:DNA excision repair protein ERCC-5 homolog [Saccoglossus kowalevskii]|uniref:DNA repair protein complementing XP-G cells homolog n=1 Tax=Saccoglossus kowalevskii TaxID=10224 RepID=A0ABM0GUJ1_SACKO|nr:PREDICTED: DNA repair protein complementing XP-G cells homolog [Saccoglossus kowalevskii]